LVKKKGKGAMELENHRGTQCQFKKVPYLCQEGYCNDCQIFIDWAEKLESQFKENTKITFII